MSQPLMIEQWEQTENIQAPLNDRINILVVDDLPEKLLAYEAILEELGQNLVMARSGEEALKMVLRDEFAVILLDVNMPGLDGFETASLIRKRKKSSHTPIIFLTAFTDEIRMAQGYASGAVDYLPTPVVPEILKAKVKVFIELSQMRRSAAMQAKEHALRTAAEEADRRKDEFLAMLAHELRNPLAPISNALATLKRSSDDTIRQEAQGTIERQLTHLIHLVDDLMDVSRITKGKIELRKKETTLKSMLDQAMETSSPLMQQRRHRIHFECPQEDIWLYVDSGRIAQIFSNLLNNAAKYTNEGGIITLWVVPGKTVEVHIRDNGIGIPSEKLSEVFDLFSQVDSSLERTQGGLGIGLTLAKRLVEMHGGQISAHSEGLGKGSEFCVTLPTIDPPDDADIPASTKEVKAGNVPLKILIVDDNEASAKTMGWMVELDGHDACIAHNGPEAIKLAQSYRPDVVLLDIGLPGMSGYEICKVMKQDATLQHTTIIAQTGWGQEEHRRRSKEAGFDYHLVKPVQMPTLQKLLQKLTT